MEIAGGDHQFAEQRRQIGELSGDHMLHVALALQLTAHLEQPRLEQRLRCSTATLFQTIRFT